MKIAIYGAGAMGTVLGALLAKSGEKVHLFTRNKSHLAQLQKTGATVVCSAEKTEFCVPVEAFSPEEMTEKYDLVFLMTKQRENKKIAEFLKDKLTEKGVVCTTQNGLPEYALAEILGEEKVFGGVCTFGANFLGDGKTELTSLFKGMRLCVGGISERADTSVLVSVLKGVERVIGNPDFLSTTDNLHGMRWNKLCINAAFSSLSVVTGLPFGKIAKDRTLAKIVLPIMRECFSVMNAMGVKKEKMQGHDLEKLFGGKGFFQTQKALLLLPFAIKKHKLLLSGMLKDVEKGRKCEIDFIAGAVVACGKKYGVETPYLEKTVEIVHGIENGLYEITPKNAVFFQKTVDKHV